MSCETATVFLSVCVCVLCLVDVQRFHQKTISANFPHQRDLPVQVETSKDLLQLHDFARGEALADLADDLTFKSWSHFTQNVMIWDV